MKHFFFQKVTISILILFTYAQLTISVTFPYDEIYLSAATKAANWLISMAREERTCDGLSWPESNSNSYRIPGLCTGAAGIGLFFLKLYESTGNVLYLEKAKLAANYIYHEHKYVNMHGPDWFFGAASGGDYFLALYRVTQEEDYLNKAKYFAYWLYNSKYVEGDGYYWKHYPDFPKIYTGIAHGAAGIGMFFLSLYEHSQDSTYLQYAEKAFNWMSNYTVRFDDTAIGWKRLTTDNFAYHLWCGGSTGIIFFFEKLYKITGKEIYKDYLKQTANGLVKYAVQTSHGSAWHYTSHSTSGFPIVYCHGTSSTVHALYVANSILHDSKYLDCARSGAEWLINQKQYVYQNAYYWTYFDNSDWVETGLLTGVASIGYSFTKYYEYDPNSKYIDMAQGAANWLLSIANSPLDDQMRWINFTSATSSMDEKAYYTGWYHGAAGIGIFLLELHAVLDTTESYIPITDTFVTLKNYPNPFHTYTSIEFNLPYDSPVILEIYDVLGKRIKTLVKNQICSKGINTVTWTADDCSHTPVTSGIYVIRLHANGRTVSQKTVLIK